MAVSVGVKNKKKSKEETPASTKSPNPIPEIVKYIDRIGVLLSRRGDPDAVRDPLTQLFKLIPAAREKGTVEPTTGLPSNYLLEARMRIACVLLKIDGERPEPSWKFDPNPLSGVQDCYRTLKSIFIPKKTENSAAAWRRKSTIRDTSLPARPR